MATRGKLQLNSKIIIIIIIILSKSSWEISQLGRKKKKRKVNYFD